MRPAAGRGDAQQPELQVVRTPRHAGEAAGARGITRAPRHFVRGGLLMHTMPVECERNSTRSRNCARPSSIIGFVRYSESALNLRSTIHTFRAGSGRPPI